MTWRKQFVWAATCMALGAAALSQEIKPDMPQWQVAAGGKMAFEVASIKPTGAFRPPTFALDAGDAYAATGGRFSAVFPLATYIAFAYKLQPTERQAMLANVPKWVGTDLYEIEARAASDSPTKDQMRLMMQSLLAERFQLRVHAETQVVPVLALTLVKPGKLGPKLRPHAEGPPCDSAAAPGVEIFPPKCDLYMMTVNRDGPRRAGSRNTTMPLLAGAIPTFESLGRPVVDQTGLSGRFDFAIEWTPEPNGPPPPDGNPPPQSQGPTLLEALREQLGLKLEATKGPVEMFVIDHVEKPSEN